MPQTISLCMITKNEEKYLEQCLNSVKDIVDEVVIVDTGSTDKTKEIAKKFKAKIFDLKWNDNFSEARNESLKHATKEWILVLDADETLDNSAKDKIKEDIEKDNVDAFSMPQLNYTNEYIKHPDFVPINNAKFKGYFTAYIARLFRRSKDTYYKFYVHEIVEYSIIKSNKKIEILDVPIHHYQELKGLDHVQKKQQYYMLLLAKNISDYPEYAVNYDHMAVMYHTYEKNIQKAVDYVKKAIGLEPMNIDYRLHLSCLLNEVGDYGQSMDCLKEAIKIKEDERIYRLLGLTYYKLKKYDESVESYEKALRIGTPLKGTIMQYIKNIKEKMNKNTVSYSFSTN